MVVSSSSVFSRISAVQYAQQCGTLTGFAMWSPDVHVCAIPGLIVPGSDHALRGLMACHTRVIVATRRKSSDAVSVIARSLTTSATFTCHTQQCGTLRGFAMGVVARCTCLRHSWSHRLRKRSRPSRTYGVPHPCYRGKTARRFGRCDCDRPKSHDFGYVTHFLGGLRSNSSCRRPTCHM